jgi:hypothetical protein
MVKVLYFYKTLKIFNDLSRGNHGHGGHEHGVFGGKLSFKMMSALGRLCILQENLHFWVPTIEVRPPDGINYNKEDVWSSTLMPQLDEKFIILIIVHRLSTDESIDPNTKKPIKLRI